MILLSFTRTKRQFIAETKQRLTPHRSKIDCRGAQA